jgi:GNAT superfamily N-acetyltransferase
MVKINKLKAAYYELLSDTGEIIGGTFTVKEGKQVQIINLFINPEFQRQGYGTQLLQEVFDAHPKATFCLQSVPFNQGLGKTDLKAWYERLGFIDVPPPHGGDNWMYKPSASEN